MYLVGVCLWREPCVTSCVFMFCVSIINSSDRSNRIVILGAFAIVLVYVCLVDMTCLDITWWRISDCESVSFILMCLYVRIFGVSVTLLAFCP